MSRLTPIVERFSREALGSWGRFLASGAFNTVATYLLYLALLRRLPYQVSYTVAFASGIALAYVLNRYLVFRQPGGRTGPLLVGLIYVGQYFVNLGIVSAAVQWLRVPAAVAPLVAIAFTLPLTYLLNQRVFSAEPKDPTVPPMPWQQRLHRWQRPAIAAVLVGLPVLSLVLGALAWLRFGYDLPFFDDWRAYDSGDVDSLEWTYLFQPLNDTLTPIGLALDALAQRLLDGNSIAYQLMSMVLVLGLLLVLQWKLLRLALNDTLRTAACFVFTLLMLQPGSYWGRENLAYEQALPLVFILTALWLASARPWREAWTIACIFTLGLLSGFTYISGAFGALTAGAGVAAAALLSRNIEGRPWTLRAGLALALAGAITSSIQVVMAILPSKGGTHAEGKSLALPTESDFWLYYLGKVGRSLLLPADQPVISLIAVGAVLAVAVAASVAVLRGLRRRDEGPGHFLVLASVFLGIGAMVVTYLALVAAGRANFRPPEVQAPADIFAYGFQRFHFFWATLLWPWMVAAVMMAWDRRNGGRAGKLARTLGSIAVALAIVSMAWLGAFAHFEFQRRELAPRQATVECLVRQLQQDNGLRCAEWNMVDLTSAYVYARRIGASFVRHLPVVPIELGVDSPAPWFRLSRDGGRAEIRHMTRETSSKYRGAKDAMMVIDVGHSEEMANCAMLDVRGRVNAAGRDMLMVYFRPTGQRDFALEWSNGQTVGADLDASTFTARLDSASGFENTLRIDFSQYGYDFELGEVEVRCRHSMPKSAGGTFYGMASSKEPPTLQRLAPTGDGPGRFKAGELPTIEFRTQQRHNMASCSVLEVEAVYRVEQSDMGQLFYRPRGASGFSEPHSDLKPLAAQPKPVPVTFVVRSDTGFEDDLRLDPVKHAQSLQFVDVKVRCLRRILRPLGHP